MKRLIVVLTVLTVIGCKSKQDASIVYDSSAAPQVQPQQQQQQAPPQAAPPTGQPNIVGKHGDTVLTADGLKWIDTKVGSGASPKMSSTVTANYKGMLTDGTIFDQSKDPFTSPLSNLIVGWQEGMQTMKTGGKRRLIVPPHLGYGSQPTGKIPANSTLVFDIELLKVQ